MADWLREMDEEEKRKKQMKAKASEPPKQLNWWNSGYWQQQKKIKEEEKRQQRKIDYELHLEEINHLAEEIKNYIRQVKNRGKKNVSFKSGDYTIPIFILGGEDVFGESARRVILILENGIFTVKFESYEWISYSGYRSYVTKKEYKILIKKIDREHIGSWVKFAVTGTIDLF